MWLLSFFGICCNIYIDIFNTLSANPQNGQTINNWEFLKIYEFLKFKKWFSWNLKIYQNIHIFLNKHIKIQGLRSNVLKITQKIGWKLAYDMLIICARIFKMKSYNMEFKSKNKSVKPNQFIFPFIWKLLKLMSHGI